MLIGFGEPLRFDGKGDEEDDVVRPMVTAVERAVKALVDEGLELRSGVFG